MAIDRQELDDMQISQDRIPPRDRELYAMEDVYTTPELAIERAKEMGGEGSHEQTYVIDDKKVSLYMPFPTHEEYLEVKAKSEEKEEEVEVKEEVTASDVHIEKPFSQLECDCDEGKTTCDCEKTETIANEYALEQTFNINGIEIFSEGKWNGDTYNKEDLENMVSSFGKTGFEPPVKLGHNESNQNSKMVLLLLVI